MRKCLEGEDGNPSRRARMAGIEEPLAGESAEVWRVPVKSTVLGTINWLCTLFSHEPLAQVREVTYAFLSCSALKERYAGHAHSLEVCLFTDPAYFMGWEERNDADGRQDYVQVGSPGKEYHRCR